MPYTDHNPEARGYRHTDTSRAAVPEAPDAARLRDLVRQAIAKRPMTADEVAKYLGHDPLGVRPRLTELKKAKVIFDTGRRRRNRSGRNAAVYDLFIVGSL